MKINDLLYALTGGLVIALVWIASRLSAVVPFEWIVGFGALGVTFALAAIDYRARTRKLLR